MRTFGNIILLSICVFGFLRFAPPADNHLAPGIDTATVASHLEVPWEIAWGPDQKIWVAEQKGIVSRIDPRTGKKEVLLQLDSVWSYRTAGLLGMALHSDMKMHPYLFLNYTMMKGEKAISRLVRYTWKANKLDNPRILMEIPATNGHSGSRIIVHQGIVYWATGDAQEITNAQNPRSLNGKVLRLHADGSIPADNPEPGNPIWALGFRNIQGMVMAGNGRLYTSEHGDATDDEINLVEKSKNYGWRSVQGFGRNEKEIAYKKQHQTVDPLIAWTPTIGPAGLDYYTSDRIPEWKDKLLLVNLKDKSLRVLSLGAAGRTITNEEVYFQGMFGRLRDLCISPEGDVYISTSMRDWNRTMGDPMPQDDRIIRIFPSGKSGKTFSESQKTAGTAADGARLYTQYCASCHGEKGLGLAGVFPALVGSETVKKPELLLSKILQGSIVDNPQYSTKMPAFSFLKDSELADIANFVRNFSALSDQKIQTADVSAYRKK